MCPITLLRKLLEVPVDPCQNSPSLTSATATNWQLNNCFQGGTSGWQVRRSTNYGSALPAGLEYYIEIARDAGGPSFDFWGRECGPTRFVYVLNISLVGFLFGHVFLRSDSLVPSSLFHGVWNALDYTFFGFGTTRGIFLGTSRILFDPDEGIVGTVVLLAAVIWVVRKYAAGDRASLTVEPAG